MRIYKYLIQSREWVQVAPNVERSGCLAVVAAETEEQARDLLANDPDVDQRWIPMARLIRIELDRPAVLALVQ